MKTMPSARKTSATLRDVAQRANCSTAVVSTVINNAKGNTQVSNETRQRVLIASRELSYRPNFASRSLVRRRTRTLGVYIPPAPWTGPGFGYENSILQGIEAACRAQGYDLLLINLTGNSPPQACSDKFAEGRIDGLIIVHAEPDYPGLFEMADSNPNVVLVDYPNADSRLNLIMFDNRSAAHLAVNHLVEQGHRRIGFLGSCREPTNADADIRRDAFLESMGELGFEVKADWVLDLKSLERPLRPDEPVCQIEGEIGARRIVSMGAEGPTAWVAYTDLVAVSAMKHLRSAGIDVPRQISLVGIDNSPWCEMATPALTSIAHPLGAMGHRAVKLMLEMIEGKMKRLRGVHELHPATLVLRNSTAPPHPDDAQGVQVR